MRPCCCQVLVVTHEGASDIERVPYLASVFAPAVPLWVYGRPAAERPACGRDTAVWHAWEDAVIPLVLSMRVPADTLFVVAESDWVFSKTHADTVNGYLEESQYQHLLCPPMPPQKTAEDATSAQPSSPPAGGKGKGGRGRKRNRQDRTEKFSTKWTPVMTSAQPSFEHWWHPARRRRPGVVPGAAAGPLLEDIVFACNAASFHKRGDFVWLSYNGGREKRKDFPGWGTTALAITRQGAQLLQGWMQATKPGHLDCRLSEALASDVSTSAQPGHDALRELQRVGCYVWNAYGGFCTHLSGCHKKATHTRHCSWKAPHQAWTRQIADASNASASIERWLVAFKPSGDAKANKLAVVDPAAKDGRPGTWVTFFPPEVIEAGEPNADKLTALVIELANQTKMSAQPSTSASAVPPALQQLEEHPPESMEMDS